LRLLFNACVLRSEGGVSLLLHFIDSFLTQDVQLKIFLFLNPELVTRVEQQFGDRFDTRLQIIPFRPEGSIKRFWWEQVTLPQILRREQIDTLFSFSNTGPLFPGCRQILYMQQSIPYTEYRPPTHQLDWMGFTWTFRFLVALAQWGSDRIVVQTSWLIPPLRASVFNTIPVDRYVVSLPGLPDHGIEPGETARVIEQLKTLKAHGRILLFYPTFLAPYKKIPALLRAFAMLKLQTNIPVSLVLTVAPDSREYFPCKTEVFGTLAELGLDDTDVILTGALSRADVSACYTLSDCLVFPSVVETLGIPLLEAMTQGLPIVAADMAYAREVCGPAALYVNPDETQTMADCMEQAISNASLRTRLLQQAQQEMTRFNWAENARKILSYSPVALTQ